MAVSTLPTDRITSMICTNCKAAADLRARVAGLAASREIGVDDVGTTETADEIAAAAARNGVRWAVAAVSLTPYLPPGQNSVSALEVAAALHDLCLGGLQGCGCQHKTLEAVA
jgi:hypothetical protein